MALALVFPGQGTQHGGMLPWLADAPESQPLLRQLTSLLGCDWRGVLEDVERSRSNLVAQPLLVGVELAAWAALAARLPAPAVVAGYSVGELAAFCAAGVFDPATALELAATRAGCMERSVAGAATGLLAVRDLPMAAITVWAERHGLVTAIRLGPDRAIVGGLVSSLEAAAQDQAVAGARLTDIGVRIASHTPWMSNAVDEFARALGGIRMRLPRAHLVSNFTGAAVRAPQALVAALSRQIASPVLWDTCMESVKERNVDCVLEVGPGTTLSTMFRAAYPQMPARSVDEFRSVDAIVAWVAHACK